MNYKQEDYGEEYWKLRKRVEPKHYFICGDIIRWLMPKKVLDYGCGCGQYVKAFKDFGVDVVGYEPSEVALKNSCCKELMIDKKDIKENYYDLVFCMDVLEHIKVDEVETFLEELKKYTKKGVVVSICMKGDPNFKYDKTHITERTREWWEYKIFKAGFQIFKTPIEWDFSNQFIVMKK